MNIKWGYKSVNGDYIFAKTAIAVKEFKKNNPNKKIIDLGVGDVKFPPPPFVKRALLKQTGKFTKSKYFCGYPPEEGLFSLKNRISDYYKDMGAVVEPEEIFITTGAKPAISEIFEICELKKVAIITPTYPLYEELCLLNGVQTQFYQSTLANNFPIPTESCEMVFLCSPNNPTGYTLSEKNIKDYINYAVKNDSTLLIDGAYADFASEYVCPYRYKESERIIEVRSYSKNLCFTGLRCGYMVIKKENPLYQAYKRFLSLHSNGVNVIMQRTALLSYSNICVNQVRKRVEYYRENAKILKKPFENYSIFCTNGENVPYVIAKINKNGEEFCKEVLQKCGVVLTPGEGFRFSNSVRISCLNKRSVCVKGAKILNENLSALLK